MLNVMSKFLALGLSLDQVIERTTWNARGQSKRRSLAIFPLAPRRISRCCALRKGKFWLSGHLQRADSKGKQRLACEMTIRDGKIVYDLNGLGRPDWTTLPKDYRHTGDPHWDAPSAAACAAWCHNFRRVRPDHALKLT